MTKPKDDTQAPDLDRRLLAYARNADTLLAGLAAEKRRITFTEPFDQLLFEVAIANARAVSEACRLLSYRANRRDT